MTLPEPEIGLVIHYAYLWADEHAAGAEEGLKDRPCAILAAQRLVEGKTVVTVFPVTHAAVRSTRRRGIACRAQSASRARRPTLLVVITEFNRYVWPGVDLRPRPRRYEYGVVPGRFLDRVIAAFDAARAARRARPAERMAITII